MDGMRKRRRGKEEGGLEGGARQLQWPAKINHERRGVSGDDGALGLWTPFYERNC